MSLKCYLHCCRELHGKLDYIGVRTYLKRMECILSCRLLID